MALFPCMHSHTHTCACTHTHVSPPRPHTTLTNTPVLVCKAEVMCLWSLATLSKCAANCCSPTVPEQSGTNRLHMDRGENPHSKRHLNKTQVRQSGHTAWTRGHEDTGVLLRLIPEISPAPCLIDKRGKGPNSHIPASSASKNKVGLPCQVHTHTPAH